MTELFSFIVFIGNMLFAILYQVKSDYQKATYHLLWVILMYLIIHTMVGGISE